MIKSSIDHLSGNTWLGFISGILSWTLYLMHELFSFFTDDTCLKIIGAVGIWAGAVVAVINLGLRVYTGCKKFYKWCKKPKAPIEPTL